MIKSFCHSLSTCNILVHVIFFMLSFVEAIKWIKTLIIPPLNEWTISWNHLVNAFICPFEFFTIILTINGWIDFKFYMCLFIDGAYVSDFGWYLISITVLWDCCKNRYIPCTTMCATSSWNWTLLDLWEKNRNLPIYILWTLSHH